jgi:hypothetical protein
MTRGQDPFPVLRFLSGGLGTRAAKFFHRRSGILGWVVCALVLWLVAMGSPLLAATANPAPSTGSGEDFGQYLADHQDDLAPFFSKNAGNLLKQAIPRLMELGSWVIIVTMLLGWFVDVLLSRGFSALFAPAFADMKRAMIYATGQFVLSFIYTAMIALALIFTLSFSHYEIIVTCAIVFLVVVALAAQLAWILYLYRADVPVSAGFYLILVLVHIVVAGLISGPLVGSQAVGVTRDFIAGVITPRMLAQVDATNRELTKAAGAREATRAQATDLQNQVTQAATDQDQLRREIEAKKNSDIYVFSRIVKIRADGDLATARDQLTAFLAKFQSSPLNASARTQLDQINGQLTVQQAQQKQDEANAVRITAQARADLLARAAKGEVPLSEMRKALIGKSRAQVSALLGSPTETASNTWRYRQQMVMNPLTGEKHCLVVYFIEGNVQGIDYYEDGGDQ